MNEILDEVEDIVEESEVKLADMYDVTPEPGGDGLYGLHPNEGLTSIEKELLPLYAGLSRGMMIVTGEPGMGKGVFVAHLAWQLRRMFKGKKVLLDYKPRPLFDLGQENNRYFLFNGDFIEEEMEKMAVKHGFDKKKSSKNQDWDDDIKSSEKSNVKILKNIANEVTEANKSRLQDAIWGMDEFKRYMHNRTPNAKLNIQVGNLISVWRHRDMLVLGMCPNIDEIDYNACKYYLTHIISMRARGNGHVFDAHYYKKQHVTSKGIVNIEGKPQIVTVDGAKPLPEIGVELINPSIIQGNIEKEITSFLREKYAEELEKRELTRRKFDELKFDEISQCQEYISFMESYRKTYIGELTRGMSNLNIIQENVGGDLDELSERLLFMHRLGIVECKCFFDLYNSKN